jgi:hypothetical protein
MQTCVRALINMANYQPLRIDAKSLEVFQDALSLAAFLGVDSDGSVRAAAGFGGSLQQRLGGIFQPSSQATLISPTRTLSKPAGF